MRKCEKCGATKNVKIIPMWIHRFILCPKCMTKVEDKIWRWVNE